MGYQYYNRSGGMLSSLFNILGLLLFALAVLVAVLGPICLTVYGVYTLFCLVSDGDLTFAGVAFGVCVILLRDIVTLAIALILGFAGAMLCAAGE